MYIPPNQDPGGLESHVNGVCQVMVSLNGLVHQNTL